MIFIKDIIFVGGIHGVGKSTFCANLSKTIGYKTFSCSDLIRKYKEIDSKNKFATDINTNQNLLEKAIQDYLTNDTSYILDGHFCLLDNLGNIVTIAMETFEDLKITKIILLNTPVEIVYNNLKNRDNITYSKELLDKLSKAELHHCKNISNTFNIPLEIINPYNI